jgi:hypothetical protein
MVGSAWIEQLRRWREELGLRFGAALALVAVVTVALWALVLTGHGLNVWNEHGQMKWWAAAVAITIGVGAVLVFFWPYRRRP